MRPGAIAYLAALPKPGPAFAWAKAHADDRDQSANVNFGEGNMMYVLAVTDGDARVLYAYFDIMPTDAVVARAFCAALSGTLPPLGHYETLAHHRPSPAR